MPCQIIRWVWHVDGHHSRYRCSRSGGRSPSRTRLHVGLQKVQDQGRSSPLSNETYLSAADSFFVSTLQYPTPLFSPVDEPNFVPTPYASSYLDRSTSIRDGRDRGASLLGHSSYARVGLNDGGDDDARSPPPGSQAFSPTSARATMGGYSDPYNPRSNYGSSSGGWSDSKGSKERRKGGTAAESDEEMEMGQRRAAGQRGEREGLMGRNVFVVHHVSP